jgi:hypothetical protein
VKRADGMQLAVKPREGVSLEVLSSLDLGRLEGL